MAVETLRPEVRAAMEAMDADVQTLEWLCIRAELLRLANENADYGKHAIEQYKRGVYWMDRAKEAEAELAAMKARIADAPVFLVEADIIQGRDRDYISAMLTHDDGAYQYPDLDSKRVRLLLVTATEDGPTRSQPASRTPDPAPQG